MTQNNDDTNFLPEDTDLFAAAQENSRPPAKSPSPAGNTPQTAAAPKSAATPKAAAIPHTAATPKTGNSAPSSSTFDPVTPAGSTGDSADEPTDKSTTEQRSAKPRWIWWLAGAVVVLGATAGALAATGAFQTESQPLPTPTVTLDPPTPTATPMTPSEDATALVQALPASSLQYVLSAVEPSETWAEIAPIEQWEATYSDGAETTISVTLAQWPDAGLAGTALRQIASEIDGEVFVEGGVLVGTEEVGTHQVFNNAVVWRNGTVVLVATGPKADLVNFYTAFGL